MNEQMILKNGEIIKKSNEIIRTKVNLNNIDSSKLLASFISMVKTDDINFQKEYQLKASDYFSNLGGTNYTRIKIACQELLRATVDVELTEIHTGEKTYIGFSFFSRVIYNKGTITVRFSEEEMKYFLLNLKKDFSKINLIEYLKLSSTNSQRIFEILKSWSNLPEYTIQLGELHRMLNTAESQKKHFGLFRKKILEPAQKEIINKTNFYFEWEPVKQGIGKTSPVIAIRFIFANKKKKKLPVSENKKEKFPLVEFFEKPEKENAVMLANKCRKIYGNNCTGGHQKEIVCTLCNLMNKNKR